MRNSRIVTFRVVRSRTYCLRSHQGKGRENRLISVAWHEKSSVPSFAAEPRYRVAQLLLRARIAANAPPKPLRETRAFESARPFPFALIRRLSSAIVLSRRADSGPPARTALRFTMDGQKQGR